MLGNVRRVEEPEYPTDGVRVRTVELCLALAREAVLEVIESGQNCIDDALLESISIDVKQAHDFPLAEFLLVRWELMRRSCIKSKGLTTGTLARFAACSSAALRRRASSSEPPPRERITVTVNHRGCRATGLILGA